MVNQLITMESVLEDELLALLMLSSLPKKWETLVLSLSNSTPNGKLTFDMVKDGLLNEETKRKDGSWDISYTQNEALVMESRARNSQRFIDCSQRFNDHSKSRGKSRPKKDIICFHCNKPR